MWYIVQIEDGFYKTVLRLDGTFSKYGAIKYFKTKKAAQTWINKKSYPGMSWVYEVKKANNF